MKVKRGDFLSQFCIEYLKDLFPYVKPIPLMQLSTVNFLTHACQEVDYDSLTKLSRATITCLECLQLVIRIKKSPLKFHF